MKSKALVVDDSLVIRSTLRKILSQLGMDVVLAENGSVALMKLKESTGICVALVDWNMPVMNGIEFIEKVRTDSEYQSLKIMMVTTETEPRQIMRALKLGADEYVMKPFTVEIIEEKLKLLGIH
jgi:two-component system, chemotaxis family, chemotaxis protein CheY